MACDLWSWSHDQVTLEHSDSIHSGLQCDFYFGYGRDVIEESALNEKSCIQVLRVLLRKADTEIDELENDLVSLQTELAFAEHEEWPEICCNALRDKINCLDISIKSLKSKSENDIEVQLSMHREPAEKIYDLLRKYLQEREKQPLQVILDQKSDGSNILVKEEFGEIDAPTERCTSTNPSSKLQEEKKTNCHKKFKPANTNTTDPSLVCIRPSAGSSDKEKKLVVSDLDGNTSQWEAVEQELNCKDNKIIQNALLNHEEKWSCNIEVAKHVKTMVKDSSSDSLKMSNGCLSVMKSLCQSALEVNENVEARKQLSTATKNLLPEGNRAHKRIDEHSNAIIKYISPDAFIRSAVVSMRNKPSEFKAGTSRTLKSDNCDMEKKLAELFTRSGQREGIKKFPFNMDLCSNLQSKMVVNRRDNLQLVNHTQQFAMTLKTHIGKNSIKTEQEEVGEVKESQKAVVACDKSPLDLDQKQQNLKAKRKFQQISRSSRGPTFPPKESKLNASSVSTFKRQKSDIDDDNVCLKELVGGKHLKKVPQEYCGKEHNTSLAIILHPFSQPQESKRPSNLPLTSEKKDLTVNSNFSNSHGHATESGSFENDPNATAIIPLSSLEDMKLNQLKAIAKLHKLPKISKLRKKELIELIVKRQGCQ